MKILIIGPSPTKAKGGMASVIQDIIEDDYIKNKYDVDVYASYIDGNVLLRAIFSVFSFFRFLFILRKYDLFHIHVASYGSTHRKSYYVRALKKANKKIILHMHGGRFKVFYENSTQQEQHKIKNMMRSAELVIALSESWRIFFEKELQLKNIRVLNNGADSRHFKTAISKPDSTKNNILFLGRLGEEKGIYDLIEAIKQLKDESSLQLRCYLAGDGEVEKVNKLIGSYDLANCIKVLGWIDQTQKIELLSKVTTVILPSYNEGLPMAILEGMAAGKLIISTNVGAIPEVIEEKDNGFLLVPGDIEGLKDAIKKVSLMSNEELVNISYNNIRKSEEKFSLEKMHELLLKYYGEVLLKKK